MIDIRVGREVGVGPGGFFTLKRYTMRFYSAKIWSVIIFFLVVAANGFGWGNLNSGLANVETLVVSVDENRIFLGAGELGYYQSRDSGNSWQPFNPYAPDIINRYDCGFAIDEDADTVFFGATSDVNNHHRFSYTTDGGLTWTIFDLPYDDDVFFVPYERLLTFDRTNHSKMWYFHPGYVLITEDLWQTWERVDIDTRHFNTKSFFQDREEPDVLWACQSFHYNWPNDSDILNRLIRKSVDGGLTWFSPLDLESFVDPYRMYTGGALGMAQLSNGSLLLGGYVLIDNVVDRSNQLFRSEDGGSTGYWYNGSLPENYLPSRIVEDSEQPGTIVLCGLDVYGIYRSVDNGETFTLCLAGLPPLPYRVFSLSSNPFNRKIYAGIEGYGIYATSDGGVSWNHLPTPQQGTRVYYRIFPDGIHQRHPSYVFQRYDFTSQSWSTMNQPYMLPLIPLMFPIYFADGDILVTGALIRDPSSLENFSVTTLRSDDAGQSWEELHPRVYEQTSHFVVQQGATEATLFTVRAGPEGYYTVVSSDTGRTWVEKAVPPSPPLYFPFIYGSDEYLYISYNTHAEGGLYRSGDQGDSWEDISPPERHNLVHVLDSDRLFVDIFLDNDHRRLYYFDGESWSFRQNNFTMNAVLILVPGEPERIVGRYMNAQGAPELLISEDLGRNWIRRPLEIPHAELNPFLDALKYDPYRDLIWLSTGIGLCYLPVTELRVGEGPLTPIPLDHDMISSYPNPFNDQTRIRFHLAQPGEVEITLHDVQGRKVSTILRGRYEHGLHEQHFSSGGLASGTYFLTLRRGSEVKTSRLTLLK